MKVFTTGLYFFVASWLSLALSQSLDNFTALKSNGPIPPDFTTLSADKFKSDYEANIDSELDKDFFLSTRFFIDELLLSGLMLFNEPVSEYLNEVADYTLQSEPKLKEDLRFYVLKSNVVNAFSTDQGIIIFTTGLLAQLENEAQLAFIIAHESAHYKLKHVRKGYIERENLSEKKSNYKNLDYQSRIKKLSVYNKENELEADKEGIQIFLKTNYPINEVFTTFEVLLLSELPFMDLRFDDDFFNTELMYVPSRFFQDTTVDISLDADYGDNGSSHPNIQTRIDGAFEAVGNPDEQKDKQKYVISEERFKHVRDLCRFEGINLMLTECEYGSAIYNIYLLTRNYPNNKFLEISLLKSLYGLMKYKNYGRYSEVTENLSSIQGESYAFHNFLKTLTKPQLNVITFRYASDLLEKYSSDKLIKKYHSDIKKELAINSGLKFSELKSQTYFQAVNSNDSTGIKFNIDDSIKSIENSDTLTKSEKIRIKKELLGLKDGNGEISSADFHLYALSDLLKENLKEELQLIKDSSNIEIVVTEHNRRHKQNQGLGIKNIVIVDPLVEIISIAKKQKHMKAEQRKIEIAEAYGKEYTKLGLKTNVVDSKNMEPSEVELYNELGVLYQWFGEMVSHEEIPMITSSSDRMNGISEKYGTTSYLFSMAIISTDRTGFLPRHLLALIYWPYIPFALYQIIAIQHELNLITIVADSEQDKVVFADVMNSKVNDREYLINNYIYNLLWRISKSPKK